MATAATQNLCAGTARASSLGVEETKPPQEAIGEPPQAVVMKTFGGPDEACGVR